MIWPWGDVVTGPLDLGLHQHIDRPGPFLEDGGLQGEEAQLLAVNVQGGLEYLPLGDFDRLALHIQAGDGYKALGLLRPLALLGVVRHLQVKPYPGGVGNEHII